MIRVLVAVFMVLQAVGAPSKSNGLEHADSPYLKMSTANSCDCHSNSSSSCACCQQVSVNDVSEMACVNVTSVASQKDVKFTFSWGGQLFISNAYSAYGPPEFCNESDPHHQPVYICVIFYNVSFADPARVSGCLMLSVHINAEFLIPLKCFNVSRMAKHFPQDRRESPLSNAIRSYDREYWARDVRKNNEGDLDDLWSERRRRFKMDKVASQSSHCGCRQYEFLYCFCCSSYEERKQTNTGCVHLKVFQSIVIIRNEESSSSVNGSRSLSRTIRFSRNDPLHVYRLQDGIVIGPPAKRFPYILASVNLGACLKANVRKPLIFKKPRKTCVYIGNH